MLNLPMHFLGIKVFSASESNQPKITFSQNMYFDFQAL